ncbi:hypothetical protein EVAR_19009_1 [Eumeta japonica]|uniref:Uncharacterized protein n=1 Tax=Eumeta variegata TaxID=151549 RepID=A0A4C1V6Z4_EUMVA|nr:hypothetical protein EVAR_19009_1 [Eumeta japonica]
MAVHLHLAALTRAAGYVTPRVLTYDGGLRPEVRRGESKASRTKTRPRTKLWETSPGNARTQCGERPNGIHKAEWIPRTPTGQDYLVLDVEEAFDRQFANDAKEAYRAVICTNLLCAFPFTEGYYDCFTPVISYPMAFPAFVKELIQ